MAVHWVPGDWDKVKAGDFVRFERDHEVHQFRLRTVTTSSRGIEDRDMFPYGAFDKVSGWSLFVEAPPKVQLPTEAGTIISWEAPHFTGLAVLEKPNQWLYNGVNLNDSAMAAEIDGAPFTRLAPVAETAKKLFDRVERYLHSAAPIAALNDLRHEFGVTNV